MYRVSSLVWRREIISLSSLSIYHNEGKGDWPCCCLICSTLALLLGCPSYAFHSIFEEFIPARLCLLEKWPQLEELLSDPVYTRDAYPEDVVMLESCGIDRFNIPIIADIVRKNSSVRGLGLDDNSLGERGASVFAALMPSLPSIKYLEYKKE